MNSIITFELLRNLLVNIEFSLIPLRFWRLVHFAPSLALKPLNQHQPFKTLLTLRLRPNSRQMSRWPLPSNLLLFWRPLLSRSNWGFLLSCLWGIIKEANFIGQFVVCQKILVLSKKLPPTGLFSPKTRAGHCNQSFNGDCAFFYLLKMKTFWGTC